MLSLRSIGFRLPGAATASILAASASRPANTSPILGSYVVTPITMAHAQ